MNDIKYYKQIDDDKVVGVIMSSGNYLSITKLNVVEITEDEYESLLKSFTIEND